MSCSNFHCKKYCFSESWVSDLAVSDYGLEEEAREYVNSVHIDDDPVDEYSLPEHQQQLQEELETEIVEEETPVQEASPPIHSIGHTVQEPPVALVEESFEEPPKKTYASIVCNTFYTCSFFFGRLPFFVCSYVLSIKKVPHDWSNQYSLSNQNNLLVSFSYFHNSNFLKSSAEIKVVKKYSFLIWLKLLLWKFLFLYSSLSLM